MNHYAYKPYGLFIPYVLSNAFSLIVVVLGMYSFAQDGVMAEKKFQDIVSAAEDPEIVLIIQNRKRSITAVVVDGKLVLKAANGPERMQKKVLRKAKAFLGKRRKGRTKELKAKRRQRE